MSFRDGITYGLYLGGVIVFCVGGYLRDIKIVQLASAVFLMGIAYSLLPRP